MIKKELNPEQGNRLRECLKDKRMTQKELSEKSGYTPQHINNIIGGTRNMSQESAEIFANILEVSKEYLLCRNNYKTAKEREDFFLHVSGNYDKMIIDLLLALGINIDKMLIEANKHPKGGVVTDEIKLLFTDDDVIKSVKNLPIDFKMESMDVNGLWIIASINGEKKIIPRNLIYTLQKDIMDYAEFKYNKFVNEYWNKQKSLTQFFKELENKQNTPFNSKPDTK